MESVDMENVFAEKIKADRQLRFKLHLIEVKM